MCKKSIGGFFELELPLFGTGYHPYALALTNGRACISWILEREKPRRVHIPFYICYTLFEPMDKMGIEYKFYNIDSSFGPVNIPSPDDDEITFFVNFYGLQNRLAAELAQRWGKRLVIDDTHRFFHRGYPATYSFTSARKYFGIPDGAYLYGVDKPDMEIKKMERFKGISLEHSIKRLLGMEDEAYIHYVTYESSLGCDVKRISVISERLLSGLNYELIAQKRIINFKYLNSCLASYNTLSINIDNLEVPFCYPFLPDKKIEKKLFHQDKIFVPTLWPDILQRNLKGFELEKEITQKLLPLPIDHRYNEQDMQLVVDSVMKNIKK